MFSKFFMKKQGLNICLSCIFIPSTKAKGCLVTIVNTNTLKTMATKIHSLQDDTSAKSVFYIVRHWQFLALGI